MIEKDERESKLIRRSKSSINMLKLIINGNNDSSSNNNDNDVGSKSNNVNIANNDDENSSLLVNKSLSSLEDIENKYHTTNLHSR